MQPIIKTRGQLRREVASMMHVAVETGIPEPVVKMMLGFFFDDHGITRPASTAAWLLEVPAEEWMPAGAKLRVANWDLAERLN